MKSYDIFFEAKAQEDLQQEGTIYFSEPKTPKGTIIRHGTQGCCIESRGVEARSENNGERTHFYALALFRRLPYDFRFSLL